MHRTLCSPTAAAFAALVAAMLSAPAAAQQDGPVEQLKPVPNVDLIDDVRDVDVNVDQEIEVVVEAQEEGEDDDGLWIGVKCAEVSEPLAIQLDLADKRGILIDEVLPDSPASKAGIEKFDVMISADDQELGAPEDLVKIVEGAGDKNIKVFVLRKGEKKEVELKPGKRPPQFKVRRDVQERVLRAVRPGVVVSDDARRTFEMKLPDRMMVWHHRVEIPDDMTIITTRKGKEPAKYEVKRGDETWEATDETLDKLPKEARMAIEGMRGPIKLPLPADGPHWEFEPDDRALESAREELRMLHEKLKAAQETTSQKEAPIAQRQLQAAIRNLERQIAVRSAKLAENAAKSAQDHDVAIKLRVKEEIDRAMAAKDKAIEEAKRRVKEEVDARDKALEEAKRHGEEYLRDAAKQLDVEKQKLSEAVKEKIKAARDQIDTEAIGKQVEQELDQRLDSVEQQLRIILQRLDKLSIQAKMAPRTRLLNGDDKEDNEDADEKPKEDNTPDN